MANRTIFATIRAIAILEGMGKIPSNIEIRAIHGMGKTNAWQCTSIHAYVNGEKVRKVSMSTCQQKAEIMDRLLTTLETLMGSQLQLTEEEYKIAMGDHFIAPCDGYGFMGSDEVIGQDANILLGLHQGFVKEIRIKKDDLDTIINNKSYMDWTIKDVKKNIMQLMKNVAMNVKDIKKLNLELRAFKKLNDDFYIKTGDYVKIQEITKLWEEHEYSKGI